MQQRDEAEQGAESSPTAAPSPPERGWRSYARHLGPGVFMAMAWMGTGDLVDNATSGANYGYALMWALVVALLTKFFLTSAMAKYQLCNSRGDDSAVQGLTRLGRFFPAAIAVAMVVLILIYESYLVPGAGTALHRLFGVFDSDSLGVPMWAGLVVAASLLVLGSGRSYKFMEWFARVTVALLILIFIAAAAIQGPDLLAAAEGLTFRTPPDLGVLGSGLVAGALVGVVGGSVTNLWYGYSIQERGWRGPAFRRIQVFDLLVGIAAVAVIDLAVWVTSAEAMFGSGELIDGPDGLATMMESAIGPTGVPLLWIALFFITFSSIPSLAYMACKLIADCLNRFRRRPNIPDATARTERVCRRWAMAIVVVALIPALPWSPNMVVLTVVGGAATALLAPLTLLAVGVLTSSRRFMLPAYVNRWWEAGIFLVLFGISAWTSYGSAVDLVHTIT